jgi:hypothetical protein
MHELYSSQFSHANSTVWRVQIGRLHVMYFLLSSIVSTSQTEQGGVTDVH